jgi:hypothetical protein
LLLAYVNRTKKVDLKDAMATVSQYGDSLPTVRETFSFGEPDILADRSGAGVEYPELPRLHQKPALVFVASFAVLLLFGFVHARTPAPASVIPYPAASGPSVKQMATGGSAKAVAGPAGAPLAFNPTGSEASFVPQALVPGPPKTPEMRAGPASTAPAAPAIAVTKEQSGPPALSEELHQIKVRSGDRLENPEEFKLLMPPK